MTDNDFLIWVSVVGTKFVYFKLKSHKNPLRLWVRGEARVVVGDA
jgi:hypothetical protein